MTRDEILNKEAGPEMNALVAEYVMGQTDFDHPGFFWNEGTTEDGKDGWDGFNCPRCGASKGDTGKCTKHYSTDIAAAWQVVEKFEYNWNIYRDVGKCGSEYITAGDMQYRVIFSSPGMPMQGVTADTAPLAICRAALLAVLETA